MLKYKFHSNELVESIIDSSLYVSVIFAVTIFIAHGKAFSSFLFAGSESIYREPFYNISSTLMFLLASIGYELLRRPSIPQGYKIITVAFLGLLTASLSLSYSVSALVFFLLLYVYIIASGIAILTPYLNMKMDKEFWKIMLDSGLSIMRFILVMFVAAAAIARFISGGNSESTIGFLSTMFYPVITLIASYLMVGFWVLLPCWNNMVEGYKLAPDNRVNLPNKSSKKDALKRGSS